MDFKKGDEVVCINPNNTDLDRKIVYIVSNTILDKYVTIYGYTSTFKVKRFRSLSDYRKDKLLSLIYDIKKYGVNAPKKITL